MKRIVGSITLVVMLLNSLVTPITYANDAISVVDESPVVEENVVEETTQEGQDEVSEDSLELSDSSDIQEIQGENNTQTNDSTTQETTAKAVTQGNNNEDNTTQNNKENNQENSNQNEASNITETSDEQSGNEAYSEGSKSQGDSSESVSDQIEKSENPTEGTTEPGVLSTISDIVNEIITAIKYFFVKSSEDYITYTQKEGEDVIILEDPESPEEIIIMDRNLGAESNEIENESSYGNYYQWGNNNGFKKVDETNATSMLAIYSGKYEGVGYTRDDKFRVGSNDIWEEDEEGKASHNELWYQGEEEIQGPCPEGYHVPSMEEWNKLVRIWTKIHTIDEKEEGKIVRSTNGEAIEEKLEECGTGDVEENCVEKDNLGEVENLLMKELRLPKAGKYNGNGEREDNVGIYWTRTPAGNSYQSEVFSIEKLFGGTVEEEIKNRSNGNSLRCFKDAKEKEDSDKQEEKVLNEEEITGEAESNNVKVKVVAPVGSFPEGTKLRITTIEEDESIQDKENQLIEQREEVKEETVKVSFDITFYNEEEPEKELQPEDGKVVSVVFDYKDNAELSEEKEKVVTVYHVNDKDEEGNKIEDVKDIVVDKVTEVESVGSGVIEAKVENFSVYVLTLSEAQNITLTLNPGTGDIVQNGNVTINENGTGTIVSTGGMIILPGAEREGYKFGGWYADSQYQTRIGGSGDSYSISEDTELYARWKMYVKFYYGDEVYFDGSSYLNSDLMLFSTENKNKDFEINFRIGDDIVFNNDGRNDIVVCMNENGSPYQGFNFRWDKENNSYYYYQATTNDSDKAKGDYTYTTRENTKDLKISRVNQVFSINNHSLHTFGNISTFNFKLHFGAGLDSSGNPTRRFMKGTLGNISVDMGYETFLTLPSPTRKDVIFNGWYTSPDYNENTKVLNSLSMEDSGKTLYAKWLCKEYGIEESKCETHRKITFDANGGVFSGGNTVIEQIVLMGSTGYLPEEPTVGRARFLGWYLKGSETPFDFNTPITENTILYAKWDFAYIKMGNTLKNQLNTLAGDRNNIYYFLRTENEPDSSLQTTDHLISKDGSTPIFAWFDENNGSGIIYYYSPASTIMLEGDASAMFSYWQKVERIDTSGWDTSKVTSMNNMFEFCESLKDIDLSSFDTSKVTSMSKMFNRCESLVTLDLSNFDTSNVTNMGEMFNRCNSLISLDLSNFDTSNVTNMGGMFEHCGNLTYLNISGWDTNKVTNMANTFSRLWNLENLDVSHLNTSSVTNMNSMFLEDYKLKELDVSNFDTSNVTDMGSMFRYCTNLTGIDVSNFDTSNVTSMGYMFSDCNSLEEIDVRNFDTSNVTSMDHMFFNCNSLQEIDVSKFDTRNVTKMGHMFRNCSSLEEIDVSNFNVENVTSSWAFGDGIGFMFQDTTKLKRVNLGSWNTSRIYVMESLFQGSSVKTIYSTTDFDTGSVDRRIRAFYAVNLVGGNGTKLNGMSDLAYAKVDNEYQSGYFTDPNHFALKYITREGETLYKEWKALGQTGLGLSGENKIFNYYVQSGAGLSGINITNTPVYEYTEFIVDVSCENGYTKVNNECIQIPTYTVTYDRGTNKGETEITTGIVNYNTILSLTGENSESATPKKGFQFIGWSTGANDANVIDSIKVENDVTLYAVYKRPAIQKTITFHLNGNTGFTYNLENYTENKTFNLCEIPAKYNNEGIGSCSVSISFPTIEASTNTPVVVGWTTGLDLRTNVYTGGLSHVITVYENNENVKLYAQTKSPAKTYTVSYQTDSRVNSIAKEPDTCTIVETYNGEVQPISCPEGITLPTLTAKTGYNTPKWNAGVAEYMPNQSIYLSGDLILTGTATPNTDTAYVVKHYYQMLENNEITNKYKLEQTDAGLSGTTEEILTLANLKSEVSGFTYSKAKVNGIEESIIDLTNIKDYEDTAAIDGNGNLVIQLFYTRNQYNYVETQVANAHLTRSPENNSYYYGQEITLTGESDQGYTLGKITTTVNGVSTDHEGTTLVYTMPAANVTFTPVLREHIYTIHFNGNGATSGTVADVITSYSENKELPTNVEEGNRYERKGYHFIGWSRNQEVENQSDIITTLEKGTADDNGNVTLYAQWEVNTYEIKFVNENGEELQVSNVAYGTNPIYNGETPVKTGDEQYSYVFEKWQPLVQAVTGDITYTATFKQLLNKYTVTFKDSDGSIIQEKEVAYGTTSGEYKIADPKKTGYTFKGWTPELQTVDSDIIYKATYTVNQYKISVEAGEGVEEIQGAGEYDYGTEITLTGKAMIGYHFEGGVTEKAFIITVGAADQTVKIRAIPNTYRVVFKANGGEGIMRDQVFTYNQTGVLNANSFTKARHLFAGWTGEDGKYYADKNNIYNLVTTGSVELTAIWIEGGVGPTPTPTPTPSGGSSGGGGGGKGITPTHEQEHSSAEDDTGIENKIDNSEEEKTNNKTQSSTENSTKTRTQSGTKANENTQEGTIKRTQEELDAYKYAYKYGITTLAPKEEATPDGYVKRGHLAKMLVNYSVNVLGKEIPTVPKECKNWSDDKDFESDEIREYAEKACALGLMGVDTENHKFNSNQEVTRAQFGTTISRMLYGDKYQGGFPYYEKHLKALNENNIMKNINNPQDRIELRKWIWVMLQRIQEKKK